MISLTTNVLGVFAVKNGKIISSKRFPQDPAKTARFLSETRYGVCEPEKELIEELVSSRTCDFAVDKPDRFFDVPSEASFMADDDPLNVFSIADEIGINSKTVQELIYAVNLESTKEELTTPDRDQLVIQAVKSVDELENEVNILSERLREWYSLHFPELSHMVAKNEVYARVIAKAGDRKNVGSVKTGLDSGFIAKVAEASTNSFGFPLQSQDEEPVKALASSIVSLAETKKKIEIYVETLMKEIAPNTAHLAGAALGAKLIAKAGNLGRLARMPAGTIQILGAEDAFFRFLKTGKKPPKHGIIFTHPDIRSAQRDVRGKLSRTLAAKLAIAAKQDAYNGAYIGDQLAAKFQKRVKALTRFK